MSNFGVSIQIGYFCLACKLNCFPLGYICRTQGLDTPVEVCKDGYYCDAGAKVEVDQKECPEGSFCVQGMY